MSYDVHALYIRLFRQYKGEFRQQLENDITSPQLFLLEVLQRHGPQKMSDLAERMCVTVGAVTLLGDRLIKSDFVRRDRLQTDRRVVMLSITEHGRELLEQFRVVRDRVLEKYFGKLTPEELEQLGRLYAKMLDVDPPKGN